MRIILLFWIFCLFVSPAYAYIDNKQRDDTTVTAGDQNSSMHKLSEKNSFLVKKLKRADEFITRKRAAGKTVEAKDLDGLLLSEKEDKKRQDLKQMFLNVEMQARSPRQLVVQTDHAVYENLLKIRRSQIKDAKAAYELRQQRRAAK